MTSRAPTTGGRARARRFFFAVAALIAAVLGGPVVAFGDGEKPVVTVREEQGVYSVAAQFHVSQSPQIALAVLTDYERIPQFMPTIKTSIVLERASGRALVEQEAVARLMFFSKRLHLVLDITEKSDTLRFEDRCGTSFVRYEGRWEMSEEQGRTKIVYQLTAKPSFEVPEFVLKRVLKRDSAQMIEQLQREIAVRSAP
jgi:ribosome-associated toxin RatA of RatAB toxin-antitoxin module